MVFQLPQHQISQVDFGRHLVLAVIVTSLSMSVLIILLFNFTMGQERLGAQIGRLFMNSLFCFALFNKMNWARIFMGGLFVLGGINGLYKGIALFEATPGGILIIAMGVIYFVCAYILLFSRPVRAYMRSAKPSRR